MLVGKMRAGGQKQQICYLLQGMDRQRYRPALVVWNYNQSDVNLRKVRALKVPIWGYPVAMPAYRKLLGFVHRVRMLAPEVVHSYSFHTNFAAFWAARATGAIGVGSLRCQLDLALRDSGPIRGRLNASLPREQVCNSQTGAKQVTNHGGWFTPRRLSVVSNGLDLSRFHRTPVPTTPPLTILGIGSLVPVKRWDRLVKLQQQLRCRNIPCIVQI